MPVTTTTTSLYTILIRLNEDGSYGASYQTITRVLSDGQPMPGMSTEGPLMPLTPGDIEAHQALEVVIGPLAAEALTNCQLAMAENDDLRQRLAAAEQQLADLTAPQPQT